MEEQNNETPRGEAPAAQAAGGAAPAEDGNAAPKRRLSPQAERGAKFRAYVRQAPESPGVYIMRDASGAIIYVGKAKVLRNRLLSYF